MLEKALQALWGSFTGALGRLYKALLEGFTGALQGAWGGLNRRFVKAL
jgi:hypothetical protein